MQMFIISHSSVSRAAVIMLKWLWNYYSSIMLASSLSIIEVTRLHFTLHYSNRVVIHCGNYCLIVTDNNHFGFTHNHGNWSESYLMQRPVSIITWGLIYKMILNNSDDLLNNIVADNIDSSGVRFTLTRTPREFNAGISGLGSEVNSNLFVPPNSDEFNVYGYCTSGCTNQVKYL